MLHKQKTHLATEKKFVLHHYLKINKREDPNKLRGSEKNRNVNKRPPPYCLVIALSKCEYCLI